MRTVTWKECDDVRCPYCGLKNVGPNTKDDNGPFKCYTCEKSFN